MNSVTMRMAAEEVADGNSFAALVPANRLLLWTFKKKRCG